MQMNKCARKQDSAPMLEAGSWKLPTDNCRLCPRACGAPRKHGEASPAAFCGEGSCLRLAWAGLHFGEEPPITGAGGSGAVFVTGCNLRCPFCQNWQISREGMGRPVSLEEFASICLALEDAGAENVNIVTGSHAIPLIAKGLTQARERGLKVPAVWNSSAFESVEALRLLDGLVSVWLPDFKTMDSRFAAQAFRACDYPQRAAESILYMAQASPLEFAAGRDGKAQAIRSGVIVRHLALPGRIGDTERVLRWFKENLEGCALLSLMTQYTPVPAAGPSSLPERFTSDEEYSRLVALLDELGIEEGFLQELVPDSEWLPDFSQAQPFSSSLAKPIWHWREGFVR